MDMTISLENLSNPTQKNIVAIKSTNLGMEPGVLDTCQLDYAVEENSNVENADSYTILQGIINFRTFLALKPEERHAFRRYHAAVLIQSVWRSYLARAHFTKELTAIIKLQALVRGFLTRKQLKERAAKLAKLQENAAIKVQSTWRGFHTRKSKFNFAQFKTIQRKNEALKRSIDRINELEAVLLKSLETRKESPENLRRSATSASSLSRSSRKSAEKEVRKALGSRGDGEHCLVDGRETAPGQFENGSGDCGQHPCIKEHSSFLVQLDNMTPSQEDIIIDKLPELVLEISDSRIAELYAYLANLETGMDVTTGLERKVKKLGGIQNLNAEQLYRLEQSQKKQRKRANLILNLAKFGMMGRPLKRKFVLREEKKKFVEDAVMLQNIPRKPDIAQPPDRRKVDALKDAIRLFRQKGHVMEEWELKKNHFLLRTRQCPGVYSDICTTELSEMEKRLKAVKFWKGTLAGERMRKGKGIILGKNQRLKRLFTHALRISEREGTADDVEGEFDEETVTTTEDYNEYYFKEINPEEDRDADAEADDGDEDRESLGKKGCYLYLPPLEPPPPTPAAVGDDLNTNLAF